MEASNYVPYCANRVLEWRCRVESPLHDFHEHWLSNIHYLPKHGVIYPYFPLTWGAEIQFTRFVLRYKSHFVYLPCSSFTVHVPSLIPMFLSFFQTPFPDTDLSGYDFFKEIEYVSTNCAPAHLRNWSSWFRGSQLVRCWDTVSYCAQNGNAATDVCFWGMLQRSKTVFFLLIFHDSSGGHSFKSSAVDFVVYLSYVRQLFK